MINLFNDPNYFIAQSKSALDIYLPIHDIISTFDINILLRKIDFVIQVLPSINLDSSLTSDSTIPFIYNLPNFSLDIPTIKWLPITVYDYQIKVNTPDLNYLRSAFIHNIVDFNFLRYSLIGNTLFLIISKASFYIYILFLSLFILLMSVGILSLLYALLTILFLIVINLYFKNKLILFILVFAGFFSLTSANIGSHMLHKTYIIQTCIGLPLYILLGCFYDFLLLRSKIRNKPLSNNKILNFIGLSILFNANIIVGVFATNGFYFWTKDVVDYKLAFTLSSLLSAGCSSFWNYLQTPCAIPEYDIINSLFRAILECLSFTGIAYSTYISWDLVKLLKLDSWLWIVLWAIIHLVLNTLAIYIESFNKLKFLYGLLYFGLFSSIAFSTNALDAKLVDAMGDSWGLYIIAGIGIIVTGLLKPNFYRGTNNLNNMSWLKLLTLLLLESSKYFFLVNSFVLSTTILYGSI